MIRRDGPLSIGRVAETFEIGPAAASGFIERIERHGLIERRHRTDDRRIVDCHLTDEGQRLLEELAGLKIDALRQTLGVLEPEELRDFDRLLLTIAARTKEEHSPALNEHSPVLEGRSGAPAGRARVLSDEGALPKGEPETSTTIADSRPARRRV